MLKLDDLPRYINPIAKGKQDSLNASFIEIGVLMQAISKQVELDIDDAQMLLIDLIDENKEIIKILHSDYKTRYKSWVTTDRSYIWNGGIENSEKIRLRDTNINLTFKITEEVIRKGIILDIEQESRVLGFCRQQMMEIFAKEGFVINLSAKIDPSVTLENKSQPITALNAEVAALHQQLTAPFSPTPAQERKAEAPEAANDHPAQTQNTLPVVGALVESAKTGPTFDMTKAAMEKQHKHHWPTIKRDMTDASSNGLASAKAGTRKWIESDALKWARANNKLTDTAKPANLFTHSMNSLPGRKHTLEG